MLDRKFDSDIERNYIKMMWEKFIPTQFCKFVYLKDNFMQLCQAQITFQKANDVVKNFIEEDEANIELLRQHLEKYAIIYQFLYANLFPKVYARNNHFGIHNKSIFEYTYREWYFKNTNKTRKEQTDGNNNSKAVAAAGKNLDAYDQRSAADVNQFEQRPEEIKFQGSAIVKPKKVHVTTKAEMDARIAKKKEKRKQKKAALEAKLTENTDEVNKLENFTKKRKMSLYI